MPDRLASTHVPTAPTLAALTGWEVAICAPWANSHARPSPAKRTELTSPSGSDAVQSANVVLFLDTGMGVPPGLTFCQVAPASFERSACPLSPTAIPTLPEDWNAMSFNAMPLGPNVRTNVPL